MRNGHWLFTGDAIRFTTKPELIDGQHRMKALIKANITLPMVCVFGLDPRAKHALDMGRKRSAADALALKGHTQSSRPSGAARQLLYINTIRKAPASPMPRSRSSSSATPSSPMSRTTSTTPLTSRRRC